MMTMNATHDGLIVGDIGVCGSVTGPVSIYSDSETPDIVSGWKDLGACTGPDLNIMITVERKRSVFWIDAKSNHSPVYLNSSRRICALAVRIFKVSGSNVLEPAGIMYIDIRQISEYHFGMKEYMFRLFDLANKHLNIINKYLIMSY